MAQSGTTGFGWQRTSTRPLLITLIDGPNMPNLGNRNKRVYGPIASITALQINATARRGDGRDHRGAGVKS